MKRIQEFIYESLKSNRKFSKPTVSAIKKNILGAQFNFNIKNWEFKDFKIFKEGKYIKMSYQAYKDNKLKINERGDLIYIHPDHISLGYSGHCIDLKTNSSSYDGSEMIDCKYDKNKDITILTFKLQNLRYCDGFEHLSGTITVNIPTDIMNAKENYSDFDCKGYDEYMEKYLPQKAEYLRQIKLDDLSSWSSMIQDNVLVITIKLETGKGYGDVHLHTNKYNFEYEDYTYKTNKMLADKDYEAQIVRKFINGVQNFTKNKKDLPEKVTINIIQELD